MLTAADNVVATGTALAVGTAKGAPLSAGLGVADGGFSWRSVGQSLIPFKGTGNRFDAAVATCKSGNP